MTFGPAKPQGVAVVWDTIAGWVLASGGKAALRSVPARQVAARVKGAFAGNIPASDHLRRAVRLAWVQAALTVLDAVLTGAENAPDSTTSADVRRFDKEAARPALRAERDAAIDTRIALADSPVDAWLDWALIGVVEHIGASAEGENAMSGTFAGTLVALSGWPESEIPDVYAQVARAGSGDPPRDFGALLLDAFAEILIDPKACPGAGEAFHLAMAATAQRMQRAVLGVVEGLHAKLDRNSAQIEQLAAQIAKLAEPKAKEAGVAHALVLELARRIRPDVADLEGARIELERAIEIAARVIARGEQGTDHDAFVDRVLAEAARLTRGSDLDGAAREVDDGLAELERREAEEREHYRRTRTVLLRSAIDQQILRGDAEAVAGRVMQLVAVETGSGNPAWEAAFWQRQNEYYEEGRDKGINLSLRVAAAMAQRMLQAAVGVDQRGEAYLLVGSAYSALGRRESNTARLGKAVSAYHAALRELARERAPLRWARVQNNLGNALQALGERESGTARLKEAVAAFRAALGVFAREHMALEWAMAQSNLGCALQALGMRESGTVRLKEAVAAFRAALKKLTRNHVPQEWARVQHNLGNALGALGERESDTMRLEEAVEAFREALKEWTRDAVPLEWGRAQNSLGNVLGALGERKSDTTRLEEAVEAFREALKGLTRDRVPLDWAKVQNNLGIVLIELGEREGDTTRLEEAVAAFCEALKENTRERVPPDWAATQNNLGMALISLALWWQDLALAEAARDGLNAVLEVVRADEHAPLVAALEQNIARAHKLIAILQARNQP